jgi:hypothetical protein
MKFIITEEQNIRLQILRRLDEIWGIIRNSYPFVYPCDYHGLGHFAIALKAEFSYIDSEGFFRENENEIWDIVSKIYAKKIKERYDESNCDGEPVIEESDSHEQKEWKIFEMFMRRRGEQIRDLILKHSQDYKRSNSNYGKDVVVDKMFELVVADFCDINKIGYDDKEYDWVYFYLQDNYTDYIKDELFLWNKDTIIESSVTYRDDEILELKGGIQFLFGDRIRNVYHKAVEKKSLTESSLPKKFKELIHNQGLTTAINAIGSYEDLINIVGEDVITREVKEKFIKDVVKEQGGISVFDLNEDPIFYEKTEKEYQEIAWFGLTKVTIQVWELDDMEDTGEIYAPYENLSDRQIDEIFIMLVEHYIEGINII